MSFAIGIVDGFVAIVGSDQRQEFARGVDDGFVSFPHFLGCLAPGDFVAELAVGRGELGGAVLQRFIQLPQRKLGSGKPAGWASKGDSAPKKKTSTACTLP